MRRQQNDFSQQLLRMYGKLSLPFSRAASRHKCIHVKHCQVTLEYEECLVKVYHGWRWMLKFPMTYKITEKRCRETGFILPRRLFCVKWISDEVVKGIYQVLDVLAVGMHLSTGIV